MHRNKTSVGQKDDGYRVNTLPDGGVDNSPG